MSGFICISGGLTKKIFTRSNLASRYASERDGAAAIELADKGYAQPVERPLAIDGVQIEQRLRGMLAAVAVTSIDDRHRRDLGRTRRSTGFMMANHDDIAVAADDADGVFHLLAFDLRREGARMFGGEHASAQPVHGGFKRETRARGRLIEQAGEDAVLVVQRAAARHDALHQPRAVKQLHQQRNRELLRLDDMLQAHDSRR